MKKIILLLLLGAGLGVFGWSYYQRRFAPTLTERTGEMASDTKERAAAGAREIGGKIEDASIITMIKSKLMMDGEISSLAISVSCKDGHVSLSGSAESPKLIARATEIARKTRGVTSVSNRMAVRE
ncbi:MAG: hypothetical protein RL091_508 [Verrucomicrobiota bacterium]|jgi:osmotically-inducible protein OsmY